MLIYTNLLSFLSFHYLAEVTSVATTYLKVEKPVTMVSVNVTAFKVTSRSECALDSLSRNRPCFSYDNSLQECGVGNCLSPNSSISTNQEFFVSCNSNEGFHLFTSGSVTACLWVSNTTAANYSTAKYDCIARSAHLYTVKTIDKLNLVRENFPLYYWVGLNDIVVEDEFRWEDDNTICDSACRTQIFSSGEPNGGQNNEDCVLYYQQWVHDFPCDHYTDYYICEKRLF